MVTLQEAVPVGLVSDSLHILGVLI